MFSTDTFAFIGILVISFLLATIFYFVTSVKPKHKKKQELDQIFSYVINFIIFIWIGKIIINLSTFLEDPFAVLAYPSDSKAFYVATILLIVNIFYNMKRKKQDVKTLFLSFIPILITASFVFDFLQFTVNDTYEAGVSLIVLAILITMYVLLVGKLQQSYLQLIIFFIWLTSQLILSAFISYPVLFGYSISMYYFVSLIILVSTWFVYSSKRRRT